MTTTITTIRAANIDALAQRAPELAATLRRDESPPPASSEESPQAAAAAVAQVVVATGPGAGPPLYMLGPESGRRPRAVLERLGGVSRQPVVLVYPGTGPLAAALSSDDWRDVIADPRVRWAVGADGVAACRAVFGDDPCFWFHDSVFIPGSLRVERELSSVTTGRWPRDFIAAAGADLQRSLDRLDRLRAAYREHRRGRPPLATLDRAETRVLGVTDVHTSALRFIYRDLLAAAARLGHETRLHEEDHRSDPFRIHRRARTLLSFRPDLLLSLVQSGWQSFGALAEGLPTAVYYSSDPNRYPLDAAGFTPQDVIFVADRQWVNVFTARGLRAAVVPLATALHEAVLPADGTAWRCDVAIVANIGDVSSNLPNASAALRRSLHELAAVLARDRSFSADELIAASAWRHQEHADRRLARAVESVATTHLRVRAAVLLAEAGLDLRVYGNTPWRAALAGTSAAACYRRPLDYAREVPAAYRFARVLVNIGSCNAPEALNMRAYDVPAVGGCLATDDRPALRAAFDVGREVLAFRAIDELPALVRAVIEDPARRERIARAGHARVLRDHTYDRRWMTIRDACCRNHEASKPDQRVSEGVSGR